MRRLRDAMVVLLGVVCAGYWLGNSGVGLALLWLESRRQKGGGTEPARGVPSIDGDELTFACVGDHHLVLVGREAGRVEVFRDEVSAADWARLRRRCYAFEPAARRASGDVQPATGRSTSI